MFRGLRRVRHGHPLSCGVHTHRGEDVVAEDKRLIYNYSPRFAGKHTRGPDQDDLPFEQVYIFKHRRQHTAA